MPHWLKALLKVLAILASIPVILIGALIVWEKLTMKPSVIVDFKPTTFVEKADVPFFYSIGGALKYGPSITPDSPTLLTVDRLTSVMVAPDNRMLLAIKGDSALIIAADGSSVKLVARVASIFTDSMPEGRHFIHDNKFMWSRDSRYLYFVKDEYLGAARAQITSPKAELWRYEIASGTSTPVMIPFTGSDYALGANGSIYFDGFDSTGSYIYGYFDGKQVKELEVERRQGVNPLMMVHIPGDTPFATFESYDFQSIALADSQAVLVKLPDHSRELRVRDKAIFRVAQGKGFKGKYYCLDLSDAAFLPGNRYLFLSPQFCNQKYGNLVVDAQTGRYKTLPADTRIYVRINTDLYPQTEPRN